LKRALLHPQARRDQQWEVRYHRDQARTRVAVRVANATSMALGQIEAQPGLGSPALGRLLEIPGLRTRRVAGFPLVWLYFEREDHLDVVRLLGARQDVASNLGGEFDSD
jgi:toxin ParE1/3/4